MAEVEKRDVDTQSSQVPDNDLYQAVLSAQSDQEAMASTREYVAAMTGDDEEESVSKSPAGQDKVMDSEAQAESSGSGVVQSAADDARAKYYTDRTREDLESDADRHFASEIAKKENEYELKTHVGTALTGAAAGAAAGAAFFGIGAIPGAIVGGVGGLAVGTISGFATKIAGKYHGHKAGHQQAVELEEQMFENERNIAAEHGYDAAEVAHEKVTGEKLDDTKVAPHEMQEQYENLDNSAKGSVDDAKGEMEVAKGQVSDGFDIGGAIQSGLGAVGNLLGKGMDFLSNHPDLAGILAGGAAIAGLVFGTGKGLLGKAVGLAGLLAGGFAIYNMYRSGMFDNVFNQNNTNQASATNEQGLQGEQQQQQQTQQQQQQQVMDTSQETYVASSTSASSEQQIESAVAFGSNVPAGEYGAVDVVNAMAKDVAGDGAKFDPEVFEDRGKYMTTREKDSQVDNSYDKNVDYGTDGYAMA